MPAEVAGLWFGIFTADRGGTPLRTLYVAGTESFDPEDDTADWAASGYLWEPEERYVVLPGLASLPEQPYEVPLAYAAEVLRELCPWAAAPHVGVAVGYDDGDLLVLHVPNVA